MRNGHPLTLLPWKVAEQLKQLGAVTQSLAA